MSLLIKDIGIPLHPMDIVIDIDPETNKAYVSEIRDKHGSEKVDFELVQIEEEDKNA